MHTSGSLDTRTMQGQRFSRRNRLPRPRLQLRLVGAFAGLCALAIVAQTLAMGAQMTELAESLPADGPRLADSLPSALWSSLAWSCALVLPAVLIIGVQLTFRIAGPLYRFEHHLRAVTRGEQPGPCKIRKGDDLQELCELINDALEVARTQGSGESESSTRRAA